MSRVVKKAAVRRNEIIDVAEEYFYKKGYAKTSVRDIIDHIGIAKGTFYHHYKSKQALLDAVIERSTLETVEQLAAIANDPTSDARSKIRRVYTVIGNWKADDHKRALARLDALYQENNVFLLHNLNLRSIEASISALSRIIEQGVSEGVFDTEHVQDTAEIVLQISHAFSDTFARILLNGDSYENPMATVSRKKVAFEYAIEHILGAPAGSLPLFGPVTISAWFR